MKKILLGLCLILGLAACGNKTDNSNTENKPTIKIGATLPLSGNVAYIGVSAKNALEMLLEKWNNIDTKYKYEIVYENDMLKPQQAVLNTHKFVDIDKVNVVISLFGVVDRPVDEIANQNKVISLSCSHGKDKLPKYGLNVGQQNEEIYALTLKRLRKANAKKVALVGSNSAVSNVLLDYAAEHLPQDGVEIIANDRYAIEERDYRLSIQKIEQKNPDYYLVFGVEPMNSIFAKQYWEATGKNNLLSLGNFANISLDVFPPINGVLSTYMPWTDEFDKSYNEKYHNRVETCSSNLYDGLDMIIKAFESTTSKQGESIPDNADVLKTVKNFKTWHGAAGTMQIEPNGVIRPSVDMRVYHEGKWVKVEE